MVISKETARELWLYFLNVVQQREEERLLDTSLTRKLDAHGDNEQQPNEICWGPNMLKVKKEWTQT